MFTLRALDLHLETHFAAALFQGRQCVTLLCAEPVAVLRQEVALEGFDDRRQPHHLTCPQAMVKLSIKRLIRSRA
jgi:hypothetical protein